MLHQLPGCLSLLGKSCEHLFDKRQKSLSIVRFQRRNSILEFPTWYQAIVEELAYPQYESA